MKTSIRLCLIGAIILSFNLLAEAQTPNVLIWDHDNDSHYTDPDDGQLRGSEYGLQQALSANNVTYTTLSFLPSDLSNYDIVFVALGIYCVG